jgi:hypothetical protein
MILTVMFQHVAQSYQVGSVSESNPSQGSFKKAGGCHSCVSKNHPFFIVEIDVSMAVNLTRLSQFTRAGVTTKRMWNNYPDYLFFTTTFYNYIVMQRGLPSNQLRKIYLNRSRFTTSTKVT